MMVTFDVSKFDYKGLVFVDLEVKIDVSATTVA